MTTDKIRTADPAAVTRTGSTMLVRNVFQRLLTAPPGKATLKPDAAQDCRFKSRRHYQCILQDKDTFSNGEKVTARDVKFSIERAVRLDKSRLASGLLSSLRRIETPQSDTVEFILSRYDTQFPWALASPAASIVDAKAYNADHVQKADAPIVGSGRFKVADYTNDELHLVRNPHYEIHDYPKADKAVIKTMPDSASIEDAMQNRRVDVVWRGLSSAATKRLQRQIAASSKDRSKNGFSQTDLPGARVEQLEWNPDSHYRSSKAMRAVIAEALREDRTLDSVVPNGVTGHQTTFRLGGKTTAKVTWKKRRRLTLGYDSTAPNSLDLATRIRTRLEDTGGLSVLLRADADGADLQLRDRKTWAATGIAWLQPILNHPLQRYAHKTDKAEAKARRSGDRSAQMGSALATLQHIAAQEKILLPISQEPEYVYSAQRVSVSAHDFGPGWQLRLWEMTVSR